MTLCLNRFPHGQYGTGGDIGFLGLWLRSLINWCSLCGLSRLGSRYGRCVLVAFRKLLHDIDYRDRKCLGAALLPAFVIVSGFYGFRKRYGNDAAKQSVDFPFDPPHDAQPVSFIHDLVDAGQQQQAFGIESGIALSPKQRLRFAATPGLRAYTR